MEENNYLLSLFHMLEVFFKNKIYLSYMLSKYFIIQ